MSAAIYTRQSIEKKDSESIETQLEYAKKYIEPDESFDVYTDAGFSGKNTIRPGFQHMLKGIESGKYDKVIVYKLDRISRNVADFSWLMELMKKHECTFISAKENFSLDTPAGRAMLYMTSTFAQMERESTSERVKDNYYERLKLGVIGGGPPPLGYDLVTKTVMGKKHTIYMVNPEIDIIKTMFEIYSFPTTSLADVKRELKFRYGRSMQTSDISRRLRNPTYVKADASIYNYYYKLGTLMGSEIARFDGIHGCLIAGKRKSSDRKYTDVKNHIITVGLHEGVINSVTFLFCQKKLSKNKQIKNTYKGKHSWLSGIIKCGNCGYAMVIKRYKIKNGIASKFYCNSHSEYDESHSHSHHVYDIEEIVKTELEKKIRTINKLEKEDKENTSKKITQLYNQVADTNAKIENLVLNLEQASNLSLKYINNRINELHALKANLEAKIYNTDYNDDKIYTPKLEGIWDDLTMENKKELSRTLIDKIFIYPDNSIGISWKI